MECICPFGLFKLIRPILTDDDGTIQRKSINWIYTIIGLVNEMNFVVKSASFQSRWETERFDIYNIPMNDHYVNGHREEYHTVLDIIDEKIPELITLESFGMRSETLAKFIYDLDKRFYYLKMPNMVTYEDPEGNNQFTFNLLFTPKPGDGQKLEKVNGFHEA